MKLLIFSCVLSLSALVKAADFPPRFAYLVVPSVATNATNATSTTPQPPQQDDKENIEALNERIMERLRQEAGAERGVYHVYLPDGRLQRVQYTAAPVQDEVPAQAQPAQYPRSEKQEDARSSNAQQDGPAAPQGFYYVEVPQDRFEQLRAQQAANSQQANEQNQQEAASGRYSENAAAQVNAQFVPVKFVSAEQMSQLRSYAAATASSDNEQSPASAQQQYFRQSFSFDRQRNAAPENGQKSRNGPGSSEQAYSGSSQQQNQQQFASDNADNKEYVASLRYAEVQPITGPVFSYSPQELVRILRKA